MTDLSKGIIDILGVEISNETSPSTIENALSSKIDESAYTKNKKGQGIYFKNIPIFGRHFNVDLFFYLGKLDNIKLTCCDTPVSFAEQFKVDCEWLKSLLGEPTQAGTNGVVYNFPSVQIGATLWESDGRSGPDEFIQISY